jgi:hypothetical protein
VTDHIITKQTYRNEERKIKKQVKNKFRKTKERKGRKKERGQHQEWVVSNTKC